MYESIGTMGQSNSRTFDQYEDGRYQTCLAVKQATKQCINTVTKAAASNLLNRHSPAGYCADLPDPLWYAQRYTHQELKNQVLGQLKESAEEQCTRATYENFKASGDTLKYHGRSEYMPAYYERVSKQRY